MAKDPIDEFIALPKDQQLSTLQQLSPEKQNKLLGEIKTRKSKPAPNFTANLKREGTYQMAGPSGTFQGVPYSRVMEASKAGFKIKPEDRGRYAKDLEQARRFQPGYRPTVPAFQQPRPHEHFWSTPPPAPTPRTDLPQAAGAPVSAVPGWFTAIQNRVQQFSQPRDQHNWGNFFKRVSGGLAGVATFPTEAAGALIDSVSDDPDVANAAKYKLSRMMPAEMTQDRIEEFRQDWAKDHNTALNNLAADIVTLGLAHKASRVLQKTPSVGELRRTVAEKYAPRQVELAGTKVPVLVGEAAPETRPGRMQISLKRGGTGAAKFDAVTRAQQAAVKNVIRKVAQQTSGMTGPMAEEPGAAMQDAADATFAKARPMYNALDASLKTVPDTLQGVSKILNDAIARAKKLGITLGDENVDLSKIRPDKEGSIQWGGTRISKITQPERWNALVKEGIIDESGNGTPLSAYIKVRSQLLKMQRSTADPAMRNAINNEVHTMNDNMETALKGTPLYKNWTEANRLWSKGYALRDVADAITKTTKGTPAAAQAPGLSPVQTRIQGTSLVKRLNDLQENGILDRAFTQEEKTNLRQATDILDRARASAGNASSFMHGYSLRSVMWRAIIKMPTLPFVNAMTKLDGLDALKAAEAAKTPSELANALVTLTAAVVATQQSKTPKQLRDEAQQLQQQQTQEETPETEPTPEEPAETDTITP